MRFTDRKTLFTDRIPLLSIRSIRTDRHMAYTDRYGAGVLDNPRKPQGKTYIWVLLQRRTRLKNS